jgi:hypothetical protein
LTGVWATGWLPKRPRSWLLTKLRGIDLLRYANLFSAGDVIHRLRRQDFEVLQVKAKGIYGRMASGYALSERGLIALYRLALRLPLMRSVLIWIGPGFEIMSRKPNSGIRKRG